MSKITIQHFDDTEALVSFIETTPRCKGANRASETGLLHWGGPYLNDAAKLLRYGWPEGRKFMSDLLTLGRAATATINAPSHSLDVSGAYPFIPAAIAGDPMNMYDFNPEDSKARPVVRLYVGIVHSAIVPVNVINNIGGACLSLVDQMESAGYQMEIITYFTTKCGSTNNFMVHTVKVKSAGTPLDLDRCAFALCNPAMSRRFAFAVQERTLGQETSTQRGYGQIMSMPADLIEPNSVVLPVEAGNKRECQTLAGACEWLKEHMINNGYSDIFAKE